MPVRGGITEASVIVGNYSPTFRGTKEEENYNNKQKYIIKIYDIKLCTPILVYIPIFILCIMTPIRN